MTISVESSGLAVWCDNNGLLLEVLQDANKLTDSIELGQPLRQICDPMSRRKFDRMLSEAREKRAVYDWNLNLANAGVMQAFHFAAGSSGDNILLIGTENASTTDALYEELVRINSDQANALRAALKELAEIKQHIHHEPVTPAAPTHVDLTQFTQLNNELVNLQRELSKRNEELAALNEQKNRFLGMAAHDLRNPLGAIAGFAKLLNAGVLGSLNEKQHELTEKIQRSSDFMLKLVNELLDVSKIEAGKLELNIEPIEILELLRQTICLHEYHADAKQIELRIDAVSTLPDRVWLDPDKIEQVISNLVSNAIKYSPSSTQILIRVQTKACDLLIEVIDQGQGIPAEEQETLFQPFQKTSVKSTAGEKSTGLGLAIVQRIVQGHGGGINVSSQPGQGSCFCVRLPTDRRKKNRPTAKESERKSQ